MLWGGVFVIGESPESLHVSLENCEHHAQHPYPRWRSKPQATALDAHVDDGTEGPSISHLPNFPLTHELFYLVQK